MNCKRRYSIQSWTVDKDNILKYIVNITFASQNYAHCITLISSKNINPENIMKTSETNKLDNREPVEEY